MKELIKQIEDKIYYNDYDLSKLALKYGTPLKITFLDIIKEHVISLKESFDKAILNNNYNGKFIYLNANKANYGPREIEAAFDVSDGLETSSYYDLLLTKKLFEKHPEYKNKYLVCNGYKLNDYIDTIINCYNEGYKIIDIIDSVSEYEILKETELPIEVGLRVHLEAQYNEHDDEPKNDRFGLTKSDLNYILNDLSKTNLLLTTIHYHQRGFDFEEDKFMINFEKTFNLYVEALKKYPTIKYFDIGGGTPLPTGGGFDYDKYTNLVISSLKSLCKKNDCIEPSIISENGKYSQKDAVVNLYQVIGVKRTDEYPWYIINGSLLIALPEMYALGEPMIIKPVNHLDSEMVKAHLGGATCDCDDVYQEKSGYINLPVNTDHLYIGILGTGSYQNSMNGKGGIHHCLLPEEIDLVIDGNKEYLRSSLQSIDDILRISKF